MSSVITPPRSASCVPRRDVPYRNHKYRTSSRRSRVQATRSLWEQTAFVSLPVSVPSIQDELDNLNRLAKIEIGRLRTDILQSARAMTLGNVLGGPVVPAGRTMRDALRANSRLILLSEGRFGPGKLSWNPDADVSGDFKEVMTAMKRQTSELDAFVKQVRTAMRNGDDVYREEDSFCSSVSKLASFLKTVYLPRLARTDSMIGSYNRRSFISREVSRTLQGRITMICRDKVSTLPSSTSPKSKLLESAPISRTARPW